MKKAEMQPTMPNCKASQSGSATKASINGHKKPLLLIAKVWNM
jgi:hypothetical protein